MTPNERNIDLYWSDEPVDRTETPTFIDLKYAKEWITRYRPLLWIGSIFSRPSGLPAGTNVTEAILGVIYPEFKSLTAESHEYRSKDWGNDYEKTFLQQLGKQASQFSLEELIDLITTVGGLGIDKILLDRFRQASAKAHPSLLHRAVVEYYKRGLSSAPVCFTTNWDTLLERAFRDRGYTVHSHSPKQPVDSAFGRGRPDANAIWIYHPHGSFDADDVVCSAFSEQQGVPIPEPGEWLAQPVLFLGYSGYEPSIYRYLDWSSGPQLWCIYEKQELADKPAKRRLLCKPNTRAYVGDVQLLLRKLGVLNADIASNEGAILSLGIKEPIDLEAVRTQMLAMVDPSMPVQILRKIQSGRGSDSALGRKHMIKLAIDRHIRNRVRDDGLMDALDALRNDGTYRFPEQIWASKIAYLQRNLQTNAHQDIPFALAQD